MPPHNSIIVYAYIPFIMALCQIPLDVPVKYRFRNFMILIEGCGWVMVASPVLGRN